MFGPGILFDWMIGAPFVPPNVSRYWNEDSPDPNAARVGTGNCMSTLTPWSCPILPGVYSAVEAKLTISTRADADVWLARLTGKTLACNCRCPPDACWAELLRNAHR